MSFCRKCGAKLAEEDKFCNKCGTRVIANEENRVDYEIQNSFDSAHLNIITEEDVKKANIKRKFTGTDIAILIFSILSCIFSFRLYFIPLFWMIPMAIYWFISARNGKKTSTAFKVCYILFVNVIGGALMFSNKD